MASRIKTTNELVVDGNWGDLSVTCSFTSVFDRDHSSFMTKVACVNTDPAQCIKFSIQELRDILAFAESEFDRLGEEPIDD